jgi:hypothetical protein
MTPMMCTVYVMALQCVYFACYIALRSILPGVLCIHKMYT